MNEFLERVRAINADDNLAHYINKVYLFGSFLDKERNDYGDIDLGIEIKPKNYKDDDEYEKKCLEIADQSGRHFSSYLDRVFYAENLIFKKLKNRNQYLSFHTLQDKVFEVTEKREIYSFKKKKGICL
ncbi:MAG: nucleotidyltransferase domain-containing protein [Tannerellaceae bacterium]|nr:nucleotidyltransferase domain-containing protein [Tannerellaceae bacterium]